MAAEYTTLSNASFLLSRVILSAMSVFSNPLKGHYKHLSFLWSLTSTQVQIKPTYPNYALHPNAVWATEPSLFAGFSGAVVVALL